MPSNFLHSELCIHFVEEVIQVHRIRERIG